MPAVLSDSLSRLSARLARALPAHYRQDEAYRTADCDLLKDYAGRTTYPGFKDTLGLDGGEREKQIINLTRQAAEAFTMNLAANRPRFSCTSRYEQYRAFATKMGRALDRYAEQMYLEEILQDIVRRSFFTLGVAKVAQADSTVVNLASDYRSEHGYPFVESIALKNLVRDVNADCPEEAAFIGNKYDVSYDAALASPRFKPWAKKEFERIGPNNQSDDEEVRDYELPIEETLTLCDVFIRSRNAVWTFVCDNKFNLRLTKPIQRQKWTGAECGPFYFLNMGPTPGHFFPSSPGQNGKLLQQLVNTTYRKLEDQARRMKLIGFGNSEDVQLLRDAKDGEYIPLTNPQEAGTLRLDGQDQNLFTFFLNARDQWSKANGNVDFQTGAGQSADTASQERMIGANVSNVQAFYQGRYVAFVRKVASGLARLLWQDANLRIPGHYQIPGTNFNVQDAWEPAGKEGSRDGNFDHYVVDIDPYSMPYRSPSETAAFLDAQMAKWMPALPYLAQFGIQPDLPEYFEELADLTNTPALKRIFKTNQPVVAMQDAGSTPEPGGPKEYVHRAATPRGGNPDQAALQGMSAPQSNARTEAA